MKSSYSGTPAVRNWHPVGKALLSAMFATVVAVSATGVVMAAEGELVWVKRAGGPDSVTATAISALPDGTALVAGRFRGPATFGPSEPNETTLIAGTLDHDLFVAKYTPYGTLEWAKQITANFSPAERFGIAVMGSGSALVTASFGYPHSSGGEEVTFNPGGPNETTLTGVGGRDIFVAKYNSNGTLAWARRDGGTSDEYSTAVAAMRDGSAIVTGHFSPRTTFGAGEPNQTTLNADGIALFVAKYDPDGTLAWAKRGGGQSVPNPKTAVGRGIMALRDGSVVVTGSFDRDATFGEGEPNETTLTSSGSHDMFVAKYNPNGTLGWAKRAGGIQSDAGAGVGALADGGAVLTGDFYGDATFGEGEPNETTLTSGFFPHIFVAKYDASGMLRWAKGAGGNQVTVSGIATLSDGGAVVTGDFETAVTFGEGEPNEITLTSSGSHDTFVAKCNADGTLGWAKRAGGIQNDGGAGVGALTDGGAVVAGGFYGAATFGEGEPNETTLTSEDDSDLFLARFEGWRAPDLDGDGLPDAVETDTGTYNGPTDTGTDPHNPDTDGDGLIDGDELFDLDPDTPGVQNPFHPLDPDTTGDNFQDTPDGVPDGENDYDGDGQSNAYELEYGSNPLDAASVVPAVTYVGALALVALVLLLVISRLPHVRRRRLEA